MVTTSNFSLKSKCVSRLTEGLNYQIERHLMASYTLKKSTHITAGITKAYGMSHHTKKPLPQQLEIILKCCVSEERYELL